MTVLGPLPDHVARALRGESQEPPNAQCEECAADSSVCLPPDVRVGANPPYTSVGGREMRGLLAGLADREKIERIIREQAGTIAFDLAGLDAIAKGIEKQWTLAIDPATSPSRTVAAAVDASVARAVKVPVTISTVDTRADDRFVIDPATGLVRHVVKLPNGLAFYGATGRHQAASAGLEPTRVTVAGGSMLDALGFTEQVTRSRCPDCDGSGVLAGLGFGASENACDRPCPCSPPKDEGPSEWTVVRREDVTSRYSASEAWEIDVRKRDRVRTYKLRANCMGTVVEDLADRRGVDYVVRVKGEHCVDMAIARLLCGLRDGSIVP